MHHAHLHRLVGAGLLCLALLHAPPVAAYQQSDLRGRWEFNGLASGPGAPWWERAQATIATNGNFTAFATESSGDTGTIQGTFALSPTGVVTLGGSTTFRGALDLGTTVFVGTDTWASGSPGTTEMKLGLKMSGSYRITDLQGPWEINTLASGPGEPWWERGRITVAADGTFNGTLTDNFGAPDTVRSAFGMTPDGVISLGLSPTGRAALDAGKTVFAGTSTWTTGDPGTTDFTVGVKMAGSYGIADLAGNWEMYGLATGPGAPWWSRTLVTVAANGSYSGTTSRSDGSGGPTSGTLSITPSGVITRSGGSTDRGVLDAGKTVMVWTSTWTTGVLGTTELDVATRVSGSTAAVEEPATLAFSLERVHPNPARGGMLTVHFALPSAAPAQVELLDVSGRRIEAREVGARGAGAHTLTLREGRSLPPGLYLVRLRQGANERVERVVALP